MLSLRSMCAKLFGVAMALAGILAAGEAAAQSTIQAPLLQTVDSNGVNMADGSFSVPGLDVGAGTGGSGIARHAVTTFGGSTRLYDNYSGSISTQIVPVPSNIPGANDANWVFNVSYGGATYRFIVGVFTASTNTRTWLSGPYRQQSTGAATLSCSSSTPSIWDDRTGTCTLTLEDGTSVIYDRTKTTGVQRQDMASFGPLTSITRPDGEVTNLSYNMNGSDAQGISIVSSSLGWALKYNGTTITAVNTSITPCTATACTPPSDAPSATQTTNGTTTTISRNGVNLVSYTMGVGTTTIATPSGVTRTYNYQSGKVSSVVYAGQTWTYTYADAGMGNTTVTVQQPNGKTRSIVVRADGAVVLSATDEANRITNNVYDTSSRLIEVINPDGDASTGGFTRYDYDSDNRLIKTTVVPKNGATNGVPNAGVSIMTSATYIACTGGNIKWCRKPATTTDANGVTTTYSYDTNTGNVASVTLPAPGTGKPVPQTIYTYSGLTPHAMNASGVLVNQPTVYRLITAKSCMNSNWTGTACAVATDERRVTNVYSANNLLPLQTYTSIGSSTLPQYTTLTYDNYGRVVVANGPKSGNVDEVYTYYDQLGRVVGTLGIDPDGTGPRHRPATHTTYDADGHVVEVDTGVVGPGTSNNVYPGADGSARWYQAYTDWLTITNTPSTVQERDTNEFDTYGRPVIARHYIGTASVAKDVTQRSYDAMQRLDCEAVRLNPVDFGSLPASACSLGTTGGDGSHDRITKYGYDGTTGDLLTTTSAYGTAAQSVETNIYNGSLTLTAVEDAKGNRTTYSYDGFNRLVKTCYPDPASAHNSSATDCAQTVYNAGTYTVASPGYTAAYARPSGIILRSGQSFSNSFTYDNLSRRLTGGISSDTYVYDNFGQVLTHSQSGVTETYSYNALGWLASDVQPQGTVSYDYDVNGTRTKLTYPGGFYVTYAYDDGDELTGILENGATQIVGFDYDDYGRRAHLTRGNGVTTTYSYDGNLRLSSLQHGTSNTVTYGYNAADQIVSKSSTNSAYTYVPSSGSKTYAIDGLNRIGSVNGGASFTYNLKGALKGDGSGSVYTFDDNNLVLSATLSGVATNLTYDAENRLSTITKTSTTAFAYDGVDLIAEYSGGVLTKRYVHGPGDDEPLVAYDQSGNKTWLHADDNGSIVLTTNASGAQVAINKYDEYGLPDAGNIGRFQYTGQIWLPELGVYDYKARMYNPVIGRFVQPDPIEYGDGMNMYAYVQDDPINRNDPTGNYAVACAEYGQNTQTQTNNGSSSTVTTTRGQDKGCQTFDPQDWVTRWEYGNDYKSGWRTPVDQWFADVWDEFGVGCLNDPQCLGGEGVIEAKLVEEGGLLSKFLKSCGCFVQGTKVETPNGLRPIEDIKIGDKVLAYDEQSGVLKAEAVIDLIRPQPKPTYALMFRGELGEEEAFQATADHPWLSKASQWIATDHLKLGDRIESATGEAFTLVTIALSGKIEHTYNLEVKDLHTFLVGNNHLVVHNDCHHAVAKFLGGFTKQSPYVALDRATHGQFHKMLAQALKQAGFPLSVGGRGGSIADWAAHFAGNPGSQAKALNVLLDVSRQADMKFGTNITSAVWENIVKGNFVVHP